MQKFEFKYHRRELWILASMALVLPFVFFINWLDPFIRHWPSGMLIALFIIGGTSCFILPFVIMKFKGSATMFKSHVEIQLWRKFYKIEYREIDNVVFGGYNPCWTIYIDTGQTNILGFKRFKHVHITPATVRIKHDPLTTFMEALKKRAR